MSAQHTPGPIHLDLCASQDDTMSGHPRCDCGAERGPREIPYSGIEMREFNRIHLHRGDQPCWGDGKRVLKVVPPQRAYPRGTAFLYEPGHTEFVYDDFFLPEELGRAAIAKATGAAA